MGGGTLKDLKDNTESASYFIKITPTAPCRMAGRKCQCLGGDGSGLFQQYKQETAGETHSCDYGGGGRGRFKRH